MNAPVYCWRDIHVMSVSLSSAASASTIGGITSAGGGVRELDRDEQHRHGYSSPPRTPNAIRITTTR